MTRAEILAQLEYWERTAHLDREALRLKRPRKGGYMEAVGRTQHSGQQVHRLRELLQELDSVAKGGR